MSVLSVAKWGHLVTAWQEHWFLHDFYLAFKSREARAYQLWP